MGAYSPSSSDQETKERLTAPLNASFVDDSLRLSGLLALIQSGLVENKDLIKLYALTDQYQKIGRPGIDWQLSDPADQLLRTIVARWLYSFGYDNDHHPSNALLLALNVLAFYLYRRAFDAPDLILHTNQWSNVDVGGTGAFYHMAQQNGDGISAPLAAAMVDFLWLYPLNTNGGTFSIASGESVQFPIIDKDNSYYSWTTHLLETASSKKFLAQMFSLTPDERQMMGAIQSLDFFIPSHDGKLPSDQPASSPITTVIAPPSTSSESPITSLPTSEPEMNIPPTLPIEASTTKPRRKKAKVEVATIEGKPTEPPPSTSPPPTFAGTSDEGLTLLVNSALDAYLNEHPEFVFGARKITVIEHPSLGSTDEPTPLNPTRVEISGAPGSSLTPEQRAGLVRGIVLWLKHMPLADQKAADYLSTRDLLYKKLDGLFGKYPPDTWTYFDDIVPLQEQSTGTWEISTPARAEAAIDIPYIGAYYDYGADKLSTFISLSLSELISLLGLSDSFNTDDYTEITTDAFTWYMSHEEKPNKSFLLLYALRELLVKYAYDKALPKPFYYSPSDGNAQPLASLVNNSIYNLPPNYPHGAKPDTWAAIDEIITNLARTNSLPSNIYQSTVDEWARQAIQKLFPHSILGATSPITRPTKKPRAATKAVAASAAPEPKKSYLPILVTTILVLVGVIGWLLWKKKK